VVDVVHLLGLIGLVGHFELGVVLFWLFDSFTVYLEL
jgi:hypothetical protein